MEKYIVLDEILNEITTVRKEQVAIIISESAEKFDEMVLGYEMVPEEFVAFLLKLFSCSRVQNSHGIENYLLELNVDFYKYTESQKEKILSCLKKNAGFFIDKLSRHSIGDFIARAFSPEVSFKAFKELTRGNSNEQHVAFVVLDVLRRRIPQNPKLSDEIIQSWNELTSTRP